MRDQYNERVWPSQLYYLSLMGGNTYVGNKLLENYIFSSSLRLVIFYSIKHFKRKGELYTIINIKHGSPDMI